MSHDPLGFPAPLGVPPRFEEPLTERESSLPPEQKKPKVWLHFLLFGLTALSMQFTVDAARTKRGPAEGDIRPSATRRIQSLSLLGDLASARARSLYRCATAPRAGFSAVLLTATFRWACSAPWARSSP